ncbi:unnamed protein product [Pleuronectes platessa]|uniref:Uncharacterized protein n=1 Tax=Pleuronectes platessa TaxID=8262 RepID=A0A9N7Z013_PLEPL|nr:unnamed protein product [Pleuronectes platessa]
MAYEPTVSDKASTQQEFGSGLLCAGLHLERGALEGQLVASLSGLSSSSVLPLSPMRHEKLQQVDAVDQRTRAQLEGRAAALWLNISIGQEPEAFSIYEAIIDR